MVNPDSDTAKRMERFLRQNNIEVPPDLRERISNIIQEDVSFRVFPDPTKRSVILEFSTGVNYIGFTPKQARKVAKSLVAGAIYIERHKDDDK